MEIQRPSRSEYLRPSSPDGILRFENASRFIDAYSQQIIQPRLLLNHVGTVPCESDSAQIAEREACWAEYLFREPPPPHQWIWGRTILAEVVSKEILQATFGRVLEASGMFVDLVPTSIDGSSWKGEYPYQKGVDLTLIQLQQRNGETVMYPVCGIDVTVGGEVLVDKKRSRPGYQSEIAMPAVVVPLGDLMWGEEWDQTINAYLDTHARTEVLEHGTYTAFSGLDAVEIEQWKRTLHRLLQVGLNRCRTTLKQEFPGYPSPTEYPYLDDVRRKVTQTKKLIDGIPIPPVTEPNSLPLAS